MEVWLTKVGMDTVIALGVLASIFIGALVSLVMVCRHKRLRNRNTASYVTKVSTSEKMQCDNTTLVGSELELGEVCLHPYIEHILLTGKWTPDASDLITHCLEIVKLCRHVTNSIAASSVGHQNSKALYEIVQAARQVSDCVDDVVRTMNAPALAVALDTCLLEARCTALVLAVTQLTLLAKHRLKADKAQIRACDQALVEMHRHLTVLKEESLKVPRVRVKPANIRQAIPSLLMTMADSQS